MILVNIYHTYYIIYHFNKNILLHLMYPLNCINLNFIILLLCLYRLMHYLKLCLMLMKMYLYLMCMYHCIINTSVDMLCIIMCHHMLYIMINIEHINYLINKIHLYMFNNYMFQLVYYIPNNYLNL